MEISYDPAKSARNMLLRGLPFSRVADFQFEDAAYHVDNRHDYGETRVVAVGYLGTGGCTCCALRKRKTAFA